MNKLPENPNLKEINAYKKKINWGEIPTIYQLTMSSMSDIDGILSHGFDSAFKQLLDQNNWNLKLLGEKSDQAGNRVVVNKAKIMLYHVMTEQHYELHCYPIINNERVLHAQLNNPKCPFKKWTPETMQMLFRLNALIPFIAFTFQQGDEADYALLRYANHRVEELINLLRESFDIIDIKGYSIAEFCKEIYRKHARSQSSDSFEQPDNMEN